MNKEETPKETEEQPQESKEKPKEEVKVEEKPTGYYTTQTPQNFAEVLALGDKAVEVLPLIAKMANALVSAGLLEKE